VVVGTIHHYDSLLSQLTSEEHFPGWVKKIFKSVISWSLHPELWDKWIQIFRGREEYKGKTGPDAASRFFKDNEQKMLEGTKVLWPERESYYDLMVIRERDGYSSFDSEKQNEPIDQNTALFPAKDIVYWDSKFPSEKELEEFLGKYKIVLGACDPSMGIGKHSDLSAIITVWMDGRGRDGKLYVIDADIGRWKPNELKERILFHHRRRKFDRFGYEANGFQQVIGDDIVKESDREGIHIPMEFIKNSINKYIRISRLQPLIQQGRLQFSKEHSELIAQLIHYPKGTHDDGPDALSIILDVAEKVAKFDTQKMLEVFKTLGAPVTGKNSKKIISVGGRSFDDPFGLLSP